jgi:hypothetical protein
VALGNGTPTTEKSGSVTSDAVVTKLKLGAPWVLETKEIEHAPVECHAITVPAATPVAPAAGSTIAGGGRNGHRGDIAVERREWNDDRAIGPPPEPWLPVG